MASTVTIALDDGRRLEARDEPGMLEPRELEDKFLSLIHATLSEPSAAALDERLQRLQGEQALDWLGAQPYR